MNVLIYLECLQSIMCAHIWKHLIVNFLVILCCDSELFLQFNCKFSNFYLVCDIVNDFYEY